MVHTAEADKGAVYISDKKRDRRSMGMVDADSAMHKIFVQECG